MLVLTGEKAAECARKMEYYKTEYAKALEQKNFFLPPYEYRVKNLEGRFDQNKYMVRQGDCFDYQQNRADADTATKNDINIIATIIDLGFATREQLMNIMGYLAKVEPDKYYMQGKTEKGIQERLKRLVKNHLVRIAGCSINENGAIKLLEEEDGAPLVFLATPDGVEFVSLKKRGIVRTRAKNTSLFSPGMIAESLMAGELAEALAGLPGFAGFDGVDLNMTGCSYGVEFGRKHFRLDEHLVFNWGDENIHMGVISVSGTPDRAIESDSDLQEWTDMKVALAKEFLFVNRYNARVMFVCEDFQAIDLLMNSFRRFGMSAAGLSEYCYITTARMNSYIKKTLGENPLSAMLQVACDEKCENDYLTGMVLRLTEERTRTMLKREKEEGNG
ncbi:MAG: hypothetical protein IKH06_07355 [Clostridiales bacterium]|nr:hypothetical protein [Clostridiales bacterium]